MKALLEKNEHQEAQLQQMLSQAAAGGAVTPGVSVQEDTKENSENTELLEQQMADLSDELDAVSLIFISDSQFYFIKVWQPGKRLHSVEW